MYWYLCMGYLSKIFFSITKVLERGIPFCENMGFPNVSLCYITYWEFPLKKVCYSCLMLSPIWVL